MRISKKSMVCFVPVLAATWLICFPRPLSGDDSPGGVSATMLKKGAVTGNGRKIVYPVTDKAEVTSMTVDLAPGGETGWHSHPVPVYAYVLAGTLDVELEEGNPWTPS